MLWRDYSAAKIWTAKFAASRLTPSARIHRLWRSSYCKNLRQLVVPWRMKFAANSRRAITLEICDNLVLQNRLRRICHRSGNSFCFEIPQGKLDATEFRMLVVIEGIGDIQKIAG